MRTALFALALTLAASTPAFADKKNLMVFKADGNADAKTRAKVDASILALAKKSGDVSVQVGDISFVDAATAAGCKPEVPQCKDDVMATFAVDEIVLATVTRKPGVTEVWVRRAAKGAPPREALAKGTGEGDVAFDQIAPLFVAASSSVVGPQPPPPSTDGTFGPQPPPRPTVQATQPVPVQPQPLASAKEPQPPQPAPARVADATDPQAGMPAVEQPIDTPPPKRGLYVAGMIGGGLFVVIGMGMWGAAGDVQNEIDNAPKKSRMDFTHVQDLEARGDRLAGTGNLLFLGGAVLGGISTYLFIKKGRQRDQHTAMIHPTLLDHGGGIAITWGTP